MRAAVMEQFGEPLKVHENWSDPESRPTDAASADPTTLCGVAVWSG